MNLQRDRRFDGSRALFLPLPSTRIRHTAAAMSDYIPDVQAVLNFALRVVSEDEAGDNLIPIVGLSGALLKLAADCVQHIIDHCPEFAARAAAEGGFKMRIKAAEMFARKVQGNAAKNPHKLLQAFIAAIHLYTQESCLCAPPSPRAASFSPRS